MKAMDHGVLNVALAKRGGINTLFGVRRADVIAQQKADRKAASAAHKQAKAEAKELLAQHQDAILSAYGAKFGIRELQTMLDQWGKWEPKKLTTFVGRFLREQAAV